MWYFSSAQVLIILYWIIQFISAQKNRGKPNIPTALALSLSNRIGSSHSHNGDVFLLKRSPFKQIRSPQNYDITTGIHKNKHLWAIWQSAKSLSAPSGFSAMISKFDKLLMNFYLQWDVRTFCSFWLFLSKLWQQTL